MSEMTQEDALRLADELVGQALKETEARCRLLAQFIGDCDRAGSHNAAWSDALRELDSLHRRRSGIRLNAPAIVEATPHHIDGIEVAARRGALKPGECGALILGNTGALEQHAAVAHLRLRQALGRGDVHPVRGAMRLLGKQRPQPGAADLRQERGDGCKSSGHDISKNCQKR